MCNFNIENMIVSLSAGKCSDTESKTPPEDSSTGFLVGGVQLTGRQEDSQA